MRVILQVLQHRVGQAQVLPAEDGELPGLVVLGLGVVHVETKLQWPVKHVGLGKTEPDALRQVPDAGLHLKRLTQTEEVVGRVVDAHKRAFQAAHAAVQANAVLALLFDLQRQVDQPVFLVQLPDGDVRILRLHHVEVSQLVQAQQAQLPESRVVDASFLQRDLAPDHLVAGRSVAHKLDAAYIELLAFVDVDVEIDQFLFVVKPGFRHRREVDVAQLAVGLAQALQTLAHFLFAENISVLDGEDGSQRLRIGHRLVVLERDPAQRVALALFDGHRNVDRFARPALQQRDVDARVPGIVNLLSWARPRCSP